MLADAKQPALVVGSQIRFSPERNAVKAFADHFALPIFANGMARGCLPSRPCVFLSRVRKYALNKADVALVIGTPFDFRLKYGQTFGKETKIVQVDLDAGDFRVTTETSILAFRRTAVWYCAT